MTIIVLDILFMGFLLGGLSLCAWFDVAAWSIRADYCIAVDALDTVYRRDQYGTRTSYVLVAGGYMPVLGSTIKVL